MKSIGIIVAVICVSALGCSIISSIAPQGSTRKILNTVLGAFILCSMLVPIKTAISDFDMNIRISAPEQDLQAVADEAYNTAIMAETKATLESALLYHLENNKISPDKVEITLASYDNGGIYIDKISIYISQVYKKDIEIVENLTQEKFEVKPHIILR